MSDSLKDRGSSFETKYAHDEEFKFKQPHAATSF